MRNLVSIVLSVMLRFCLGILVRFLCAGAWFMLATVVTRSARICNCRVKYVGMKEIACVCAVGRNLRKMDSNLCIVVKHVFGLSQRLISMSWFVAKVKHTLRIRLTINSCGAVTNQLCNCYFQFLHPLLIYRHTQRQQSIFLRRIVVCVCSR